MTGQQNGTTVTKSKSAEEVQSYTLRALELITEWITSGETNSDQPACQWANSADLRRARLADSSTTAAAAALIPGDHSLDDSTLFTTILRQTLQDGVNPWTHRFLDKLYTTPTTLSPALELILGAMNASGVVSSASPSLSLAEEYTVEAFARLLHWDAEQIDGLTMPGGSASNILAVQTALGTHFSSFKEDGIPGVIQDLMQSGRKGKAARPVLLTSEQSHYSLEKAALACGMGLSSVVKVKCDRYGRMDLAHLRSVLEDGLSVDSTYGVPFFINATSGSTILGAFDDLQGISEIVRSVVAGMPSPPSHSPWIHCDASWGGPILFSPTHRHLMRGIEHVDSLTINPHKLLNITQQCSFALFRQGETLAVNVTGAKYLFHTAAQDDAKEGATEAERRRSETLNALRLNPGSKTMGCGRKPDAFKFYVEWLRVGSAGFASHVDRAIEYAHQVIEMVQRSQHLQVAEATPTGSDSSLLFCQVCFRPCVPERVSSWLTATLQKRNAQAENDHKDSEMDYLLSSSTHAIHAMLRAKGKYTIDKAPLVYPHPHVGYFTRLVTHPNTDLSVYEDIIREMDDLARQWWAQVESEGEQGVWKRIDVEKNRA